MKKIAAVIVSLLFLYNSMGYFILFEVSVAKVKKVMKITAAGNPGNVVIFELSKLRSDPEFRGADDKEVVFKTSMFDIVRIVKAGPETLYYCIADTEEQILVDALRKESKTRDYKMVIDHIIKIAIPVYDGTPEPPAGSDFSFPELRQTIAGFLVIPPTPPPKEA